MRGSQRGMNILEVMMAMVVLAIALTGSLAALQQGLNESRLGQNRQQKVMLAESALQRERLIDKTLFFTDSNMTGASSRFTSGVFNARPAACTATTNPIINAAVGTGGWVADPTTSADPNDLSMGAYFNITPDGTITRATGIPANTQCNNAAVPAGTVCREIYTHRGLPCGVANGYADANLAARLGPGANIATTYVRVVRKGGVGNIAPEVDIILQQVVIQ